MMGQKRKDKNGRPKYCGTKVKGYKEQDQLMLSNYTSNSVCMVIIIRTQIFLGQKQPKKNYRDKYEDTKMTGQKTKGQKFKI